MLNMQFLRKNLPSLLTNEAHAQARISKLSEEQEQVQTMRNMLKNLKIAKYCTASSFMWNKENPKENTKSKKLTERYIQTNKGGKEKSSTIKVTKTIYKEGESDEEVKKQQKTQIKDLIYRLRQIKQQAKNKVKVTHLLSQKLNQLNKTYV
ncbi:hypothetical protein ABPG72_007194 [Tetrahymena utriculariae]